MIGIQEEMILHECNEPQLSDAFFFAMSNFVLICLWTTYSVSQRSRISSLHVCYLGCKKRLFFWGFKKDFHESGIFKGSEQVFNLTRRAYTKGPTRLELPSAKTLSIAFRFDPKVEFVAPKGPPGSSSGAELAGRVASKETVVTVVQ